MADISIPVAPVPMPSADLVTFRFDTIDKEINSLHAKLDGLTANFATKEELNIVQKRLDNYTWYWRAVVSALFISIGSTVAAIVIKGGK